MTNEFQTFKRTIQSISRQEFNATHCLVGKIVDYTPNMQFCNVEVEANGGKHTFINIPAHGYPVRGSTGIIHFHNGNVDQPVCDCAYRLNPPEETLKEYALDSSWNYVDNGNFIFDLEGYTIGPSTEDAILVDESFTRDGKSCTLQKYGSYIEFTADLTKCTSKYFKFQCNYRGLGVLKVECYNAETSKIIQNAPEDVGKDYRLWNSDRGRFQWVYNKEVYLKTNKDGTTNNKVRFKITNYSQDTLTRVIDGEEVESPISMNIDGLLVFDENGGTKFYNSENDSMKLYKLITE